MWLLLQDDLHVTAAGGAGGSLQGGPLSRRLCPRDAEPENRSARGQDTGERESFVSACEHANGSVHPVRVTNTPLLPFLCIPFHLGKRVLLGDQASSREIIISYEDKRR